MAAYTSAAQTSCVSQLFITLLLLSGVWSISHPCCSKPSFYDLPACSVNSSNSDVLPHHSRLKHPKNMKGQALPVISDHVSLVNYQPDFSIVISVHNHGRLIGRNLAAVLDLTRGIWQLVVVFDGCTDASVDEARAAAKHHVEQYADIHKHMSASNEAGRNVQQSWECEVRKALARGLHQNQSDGFSSEEWDTTDATGKDANRISLYSLLTDVLFIVQPSSVWETTSDNLGLAYASPSKYFILVQADMLMADPGWNIMMSRPTEMFADIFSVSARCAHNFDHAEYFEVVGRCGHLDDLPTAKYVEEVSNRIYIRGTVNRGPLLLRSDHMVALGLLDEHNFFLAFDDHDLMARALTEFGWRAAGYFPVRFSAPYKDGTSHKDRWKFDTWFHKVLPSRDNKFEHARKQRANESVWDERQRAAVVATRSEIRYISNQDIQRVTEFWHRRVSYTLCCE